MLFMTVYSYSPKNRNEVIKRRLTLGPQLTDTVKLVGEWSYVGSGKVFRLIEAEDPAELFKGTYAWSDLGTIETYPVVTVDQAMGMVASMNK
jgi:hypothetical protein